MFLSLTCRKPRPACAPFRDSGRLSVPWAPTTRPVTVRRRAAAAKHSMRMQLLLRLGLSARHVSRAAEILSEILWPPAVRAVRRLRCSCALVHGNLAVRAKNGP